MEKNPRPPAGLPDGDEPKTPLTRDESDPSALQKLERGSFVNRYMVLYPIGEGGMGVVYKAYDPKLGRYVALKLVSCQTGPQETQQTPSSHSQFRVSLLREAQALAQLSHPNVVQVYDVGTYRNGIFLAMELIDGQTLWKWVRQARPDRPRILQVMCEAGLGLCAAHEHGIIHRDLKPNNIMLGTDGRARVLDFGLARSIEKGQGAPEMSSSSDSLPPSEGPEPRSGTGEKWLFSELTADGEFRGTPAYMAPEQYLVLNLDARTDQYSFCVTLYEALYGVRPFIGRTFRKLRASILRGDVVPPPAGTRINRWIHRVLRKGMSIDPNDRFASMGELVEALRKDPTAIWKRRLFAAGVAALVSMIAWGAFVSVRQGRQMCQGAEGRFSGTWDPPARARIQAAFEATRQPFAADAWSGIERSLGRYVKEWVRVHGEACQATQSKGNQSEDMLDRRMGCLGQRLEEFRTLSTIFSSADARVVEMAVQAADSLTPISVCSNRQALEAGGRLPADPVTRKKAFEVRSLMFQAKALEDTGKIGDGLRVAQQALDLALAGQSAYRPIQAEAYFRLGCLQMAAGAFEQSRKSLEEAILAADAGGEDELRARAAGKLVYLTGYRKSQHRQALELADELSSVIARAKAHQELQAEWHNTLGIVQGQQGDFDPAISHLLTALGIWEKSQGSAHPKVGSILNNLGIAFRTKGDLGQALRYHERALALFEKALGAEHPLVAEALTGIGIVYRQQGILARAVEVNQRALDIRIRTLGPTHPDVAPLENNLAVALQEMGRTDEALLHQQRALAIREKAYGEQNPEVAESLANLGAIYRARGDHAQARKTLERALEIAERALGSAHPGVARPHNDLGTLLEEQGDLEGAAQHHRQALQILRQTLGPDHPKVAASLHNLAQVLKRQGRIEEARLHYLQALTIWEKALGPEHPSVAHALTGLGLLELGSGQEKQALAHLERALEIREKSLGKDHPDVADSHNSLGVCLAALDLRDQALASFQRALSIQERALGKDHLKLAFALDHLATLLGERDPPEAALPFLERVARLREKHLGWRNPDTLASLRSVSALLHRLGRTPEATAVLERVRQIPPNAATAQEAGEVLMQLARLYHAAGQPQRAREALQGAASLLEIFPPRDRTRLAVVRQSLGALQYADGDLDSARVSLERALEPGQGLLADPLPSLLQLAALHQEQKNPALSLPLYLRSVAIQERAVGQDDPALAQTLLRLGEVQLELQQFAAARSSLVRALSIWRDHGLPPDNQAARAAMRLGDLARQSGQGEEALARYREALTEGQVSLEPTSALRVRLHWKLGIALADQARPAEALTNLQKALQIWQARKEPEDLSLAALYNDLGVVGRAAGATGVALGYLENALAIRKRLLSPDHGDIAFSLFNLGAAYQSMGQPDQAVFAYTRAREIWEQKALPDSPQIVDCWEAVASIRLGQRRFPEAIAAHDHARELQAHRLGENHPEVALRWLERAQALSAARQPDSAIQSYQRALAIWKGSQAGRGTDIVRALNGLGLVYYQQKQSPQVAARYFQSALSLQQKALGERHPSLPPTLSNLASALASLREYQAAAALYQRALSLRQKSLGLSHPQVMATLAALGETQFLEQDDRGGRASLEQVVSACPAPSRTCSPELVARVSFLLAQLLWRTGSEADRALALAHQARKLYSALPADQDHLLELDSWLEQRREE